MKRKPTGVRSIGIDRDAQALEAFACDYPVELVHGCAHAFLASFPFLGPELVYSDPPYLHATRRSARRYRFDYEEVDHVALLDLLKDLPCQVMVSGHPSALYDEMLAGWCQWRSKKGPPRRCKKGPLGGCGLVPVVHGRAPRATRRALNRLTRRRAREGPVGPRGQAWAGWSVQLAVGV